MNAFFILNSGDDSIVKSFGFHRSFFLNLCLLFIFQVKPVCAQPWQQLGPGAGGQERALYLQEILPAITCYMLALMFQAFGVRAP
jgi:hypothetical protein